MGDTTNSRHPHTPFLLCIMDGVGLAPAGEGNAVHLADTPVLDELFNTYPHSQLLTHGEHVGLPRGQMGNSEVGHMAIGSGRILLQPLERIQSDLDSGAFAARPNWQKFMHHAADSRRVHVVGLASSGGVHSHISHLLGTLKLLNDAGVATSVHLITDGRDTEPKDAHESLKPLIEAVNNMVHVCIASVSGRYFAMDRDKRWDRTQMYFDTLCGHAHEHVADDALSYIHSQYIAGTGDEFIPAAPLSSDNTVFVQDGDSLLFVNFRADRMRQIVESFIHPAFNGFKRHSAPQLKAVATMTRYDATFAGTATVPFMEIYPPEKICNTLGACLEQAGYRQLRMAETEKYPHVTYFFSGGEEAEFTGEQRILVNSPKVATYDLQPQMSLPEVTDKLLNALENDCPDVIVLNMANGDMVGHTGVISAAVHAVETVDSSLGKILDKIKSLGGEALIIADHGNCEELLTDAGTPMTSHTLNPVPCIYVGRPASIKNGVLKDVAPTILTCLGLDIPAEMEGSCLISFT